MQHPGARLKTKLGDSATGDRHASGDKCGPLHCVDRLPVVAVAERLPTLLDGGRAAVGLRPGRTRRSLLSQR
jgi:hypothetical protein